MDNRRDFLKKASLISGGAGLLNVLPSSVARALAIDPVPGSSYLDAEHIVFLMQENRSFDHTYGTLQGVRGFNDPRAIQLPDNNPVWLQTNKEGKTFAPFRFDIKDSNATWMSSLPHSWANQVDARNSGKYDKWLDVKPSWKEEYAAMPLTMGYYSRKDIPFYYSLADAFTICDQNFCSSLTGTTPNRLYFWTGTIRAKNDPDAIANVWNEDADYDSIADWTTFPERLERHGISWKIYQNEIGLNTGLEGEGDSWLSNFGDNPMEYFKQYHVKLSPEFIANLPSAAIKLKAELAKREQSIPALDASSKEYEKTIKEIDWYKKQIVQNAEDQINFTLDKFDQLSDHDKSIHRKAFANNRGDSDYHQLEALQYEEGGQLRELLVPKGDVLHQFREDVDQGKLPTVSWIVAPENFSDHPSSAWYGAWYISEVMDTLTKNPEVWKKTIFILTYDENDGYFDHQPPFVAPHPQLKETGFCSDSIKTGVEYVANAQQQSKQEEDMRVSPIGLGYRVPLVIASPWSRGGWVNSEVFDHTSSLQFLERFLSHKTGKKIEEPNISEWRRTVCGDLVSVFRPYNNEKLNKPVFLQRNEFLEAIHKAQFKNPPSNYKALTQEEIARIKKSPIGAAGMPQQEKGIRNSCALPYELYVDGHLDAPGKFGISFHASKNAFGQLASGSPFHVYATNAYGKELMRSWSYAVAPGDTLKDQWELNQFDQQQYKLCVYGPNGFFREFAGNAADPKVEIRCNYEKGISNKLSGSIQFEFKNSASSQVTLEIIDNAYKSPHRTHVIRPGQSISKLVLDTRKSYGWYDYSIRIKGNPLFEKRYAGRVETGLVAKTDPFMGRV